VHANMACLTRSSHPSRQPSTASLITRDPVSMGPASPTPTGRRRGEGAPETRVGTHTRVAIRESPLLLAGMPREIDE
jgi:hypothetical protein